MAKFRTHYDNLKVARDAPDAVIRAAYKVLAQKYHPDRNPDDERAAQVMRIINQSYEVLSDPQRRREHDDWIAHEEAEREQWNEAEAQSTQKKHTKPPQWQAPPQAQKAPPRRAIGFLHLVRTILWDVPKTIFIEIFYRLIGIGVVIGTIVLIGWLVETWGGKSTPPHGPKPYQATAPVESPATPSPTMDANYPDGQAIANPVASEPGYVRPSSAPDGSPWPARAAYVNGYPIGNANGYSIITVDNTENDSDVFVKLVSLDEAIAHPVRQFYIPARRQFTMDKVSVGQYDIRYKTLDNGSLSRSESFFVEERRTESGIEYSDLTMTLYKALNGNMHTYPLAADEF